MIKRQHFYQCYRKKDNQNKAPECCRHHSVLLKVCVCVSPTFAYNSYFPMKMQLKHSSAVENGLLSYKTCTYVLSIMCFIVFLMVMRLIRYQLCFAIDQHFLVIEKKKISWSLKLLRKVIPQRENFPSVIRLHCFTRLAMLNNLKFSILSI